MSAIVTGVLKFTFGLLSKKVCAYSAEKLQQGGLADQKFRSLIVGELDDINFKLDANARKELHYGISCLREGVDRLGMSFDSQGTKTDSVDGAAPSQPANGAMTPPLSHNQPNNAPSASMEHTMNDPMAMSVKHVFALAHTIGKLKRVENRYQSAMESFKKAADNSGLAFCNEALSNIEDRILACKIRITSRILEKLDDPEFAASDCKRYLKELHELSSIQQIFNVHVHGGIRAYISREKRAEIIESVIAINLFLLDFVTKCTSTDRALSILDWSLITYKNESYHPMFTDRSNQTMKQMRVTPPWSIEITAILNSKDVSAINSKGDIIICPFDKTDSVLKKFERETCQLQYFDILDALADDNTEADIECNNLAVDEEDTVYLLTRYGQRRSSYNLSVFDANGNIKSHKHVRFLNDKECRSFEVTKHKLIFCCEFEQTAEYALTNLSTVLYICDRNGHLENSFPATDLPSDNRVVKDMFSPSFDEIVLVAAKKHDKSSITLYGYTFLGGPEKAEELVRKVKLDLPSVISSSSCIVRYNYLKNNVICFARSIAGSLCKYLVEFCAKTGEMRRLYNLNITPSHLAPGIGASNLTSHPNGNVALVFKNGALILQS